MEKLLLQLSAAAAPNTEISLLAEKINNEWTLSQRKVFPTGIPDIDRAILDLISGLNLVRTCSVNHYLQELHNESFWERKFKSGRPDYGLSPGETYQSAEYSWEKEHRYGCLDLNNYLLPGETYRSLYPLVVASKKMRPKFREGTPDLKLRNEIICKGYFPLINNLEILEPDSALILAAKNNSGKISANIFTRHEECVMKHERDSESTYGYKASINEEIVNVFINNMSSEELAIFIELTSDAHYWYRTQFRTRFLECLFLASIDNINIGAMETILPHIDSEQMYKDFLNGASFSFYLDGYVNDSLNQKEKDFFLGLFFIKGEVMFTYTPDLFSPQLINDLLLLKLPSLIQPVPENIIYYYIRVVGKMMIIPFKFINLIIFPTLYPFRAYLRQFIGEIIDKYDVDYLLVKELIKYRFIYKSDTK